MSAFADTLAFFRIAAEAGTYPDGDASTTQPWDIGWFYHNPLAGNGAGPASERNLNALCRAYLGDDGAQTRLAFCEADDDEVGEGNAPRGASPSTRDSASRCGAPSTRISRSCRDPRAPARRRPSSTWHRACSPEAPPWPWCPPIATRSPTSPRRLPDTPAHPRLKSPGSTACSLPTPTLGSVQMRSSWNAAHPDEAQFRVDGADGALHNGPGRTRADGSPT